MIVFDDSTPAHALAELIRRLDGSDQQTCTGGHNVQRINLRNPGAHTSAGAVRGVLLGLGSL